MRPSRREPSASSTGWTIDGVADAVPHAGDADAAPDAVRARRSALKALRPRRALRATPAAARRGTACSPTLAASTWPVAVSCAGAQRVAVAELQRIDAELRRQFVEQRLVRDRRPAARRSRGRRRRPAARWCGRRRGQRADVRDARTGRIACTGTRLATVGPQDA
jgi:hypothetical protein